MTFPPLIQSYDALVAVSLNQAEEWEEAEANEIADRLRNEGVEHLLDQSDFIAGVIAKKSAELVMQVDD